MKQRPIGFNGKPIPHGMLYSDYTQDQIEAACNAHDFEEQCAHAQENMDKIGELMLLQIDKDIKELEMKQRGEGFSSPHITPEALKRIRQYERFRGIKDGIGTDAPDRQSPPETDSSTEAATDKPL